jgi:hypothetical protein
MLLVGMILKISWRECTTKTPPTKKNPKQKKKLKIGVKLQKNLDKNKFRFRQKKVVLLSNKKVLLVDKKVWSSEEKIELCPTPSSTYVITFHIHNIL